MIRVPQKAGHYTGIEGRRCILLILGMPVSLWIPWFIALFFLGVAWYVGSVVWKPEDEERGR